LITFPAGTVELLALILNVAVRLADITVLLAFAIVIPTTFGTVIFTTGWVLWDTARITAIPYHQYRLDTFRLTAEPDATDVPDTGL
jgi:hypothetical protein